MNKHIEELMAEWGERYPDDIEEFISLLIAEIANLLSQKVDKTWQLNYQYGWEAAVQHLRQLCEKDPDF